MSKDPPRPSASKSPETQEDPFDVTRMSFGDHLEDLRSRLVRALLGVALGTVVALFFGRDIVDLVCRPLLIVQHENGLQPNLQVLSPSGAFTAYLKIGLLSGLILTAPWVLYQLWMFVAIGLYPRERRFVRSLILPSMGLFAAGVLFLYFIVLPIVLHFFINLNQKFTAPDLAPTDLQGWLLPVDEPPPTAQGVEFTRIPMLSGNPIDPKPGEMWVDTTASRLMIETQEGRWSVGLDRQAAPAVMQSQFALDYYISFVLVLALAFGIAFETPIVVFFLAWSGLVPVAAMSRARRYVLLVTVLVAAVLTPPDVISQLLLAGPMYLLFEAGMVVARLTERSQTADADSA